MLVICTEEERCGHLLHAKTIYCHSSTGYRNVAKSVLPYFQLANHQDFFGVIFTSICRKVQVFPFLRVQCRLVQADKSHSSLYRLGWVGGQGTE